MINLDQPMSLYESAMVVGSNLALPRQTIDVVVDQLNIDLLALGCEPTADTEAITGSWSSIYFIPKTPPFSRAVRAGAHAIILREDQMSLTTGPQFHEFTEDSIKETMNNTLEGVVRIDPDAAKTRERIAKQNAVLLGGMINGLASGGYEPKASKRDIRFEFDEILDGLWSRGSYGTFSESRVVAAIMHESGVKNPGSTVKALRRAAGFAKQHGTGTAIIRLLPDYLASIILE